MSDVSLSCNDGHGIPERGVYLDRQALRRHFSHVCCRLCVSGGEFNRTLMMFSGLSGLPPGLAPFRRV